MYKFFQNLRLRIKDMLPGQGYNMIQSNSWMNIIFMQTLKYDIISKKLQYITIIKSTPQC
jgi:hypothetical protein